MVGQETTEIEIEKLNAPYIFSLAHWAKVNKYFQPWERYFLHNIGGRIKSHKEITEGEKAHIILLCKQASQLGFKQPFNTLELKKPTEDTSKFTNDTSELDKPGISIEALNLSVRSVLHCPLE